MPGPWRMPYPLLPLQHETSQEGRECQDGEDLRNLKQDVAVSLGATLSGRPSARATQVGYQARAMLGSVHYHSSPSTDGMGRHRISRVRWFLLRKERHLPEHQYTETVAIQQAPARFSRTLAGLHHPS